MRSATSELLRIEHAIGAAGVDQLVLRQAAHDGIDIALRLRLVDAVLGDDLGNEIVRALECVELLLGKLAPPGADILKKNLLSLGRIDGIRGYWVHERYLQNIDETSFECASLKQHSLRGDEFRQSQWQGVHVCNIDKPASGQHLATAIFSISPFVALLLDVGT